MRDDALRRAIGAAVVIAAAALLIGNGVVGSTGAVFNAETRNSSSAFAGGWVGAPSAATASASGYDGVLAWTPGAQAVTGQTINVVDNGTSSNCTGAAYGSPVTLAATASSLTDSSRATAASNGDWFCYQIVSTSATVWTALLSLPAVQLGLAAAKVAIANGGTANTIDGGDTITITFNQRTNLANTSVKVCAFGSPTNTILIGDQKSGNNCGSATTDGYSIGMLTTTSAISGATRFTSSSVSVSTSSPWTATITLSATGSTGVAAGATWTFTPSASILTNAVTDQAPACTSAASTCSPTTSTGF